MKIGKVAQQSGVGIETIRYYERQGLLAEPARSPSGYRLYDESVVSRLQFIRRTKELGFTLAEIGVLLSLWYGNETGCAHVRERAHKKVKDIESKIRYLQKMKGSLEQLIENCTANDSVSDCPLMRGLDN